MPRSGGEYIYNSRIIHPIVGIAESFGNAFVMIFWVYVLAPWIADPGLVILAEYQGWAWLYDPATGAFFGGLSYEWGVFVVATVANVLALLTMIFGVKIFATIQKAHHGRRPRRRRRGHRLHHVQQQDRHARRTGTSSPRSTARSSTPRSCRP